MAEYNAAKSHYDRAMEMKAMNKEDVRERLMVRADMVGQQEELEIIIDELKKNLILKINLFDKLDEEYQRYIHARRGYYENARNEIEHEIENRTASKKPPRLSKKRSGEFTVSFSLEGDLRLLHADFTRSAETLLEQMEADDEETFKTFGEYLEAQEKLRVLDEKMFLNIVHVEKELRVAGEDIQNKIEEAKAVLDSKNAVMLQLIEEQEKLEEEKDRGKDAVYPESSFTKASVMNYKDYLAEKEQIQSDLETFKRQKEALMKRKSCLLDELARIKERLKMTEALQKVKEKHSMLEYLEKETQDLELEKLRVETEIIDSNFGSSEKKICQISHNIKKWTTVENSDFSKKEAGKDNLSSRTSPKLLQTPNTFNSFLECLNKNKLQEQRESENSEIVVSKRATEPWSNRLVLKNIIGKDGHRQSRCHTEVDSKLSIRSIDERQSISILTKVGPEGLNQFSRAADRSGYIYESSQPKKQRATLDLPYPADRNSSFDHGMPREKSFSKRLQKRDSSIGTLKANEEYKSSNPAQNRPSGSTSIRLSRGQTPEADKTSRYSRVQQLLEKLNQNSELNQQETYENKRAYGTLFSRRAPLQENNLHRKTSNSTGKRPSANKSLHIQLKMKNLEPNKEDSPLKEKENSRLSQLNDSSSKTRRKKHFQNLVSQVTQINRPAKTHNKTATDIKNISNHANSVVSKYLLANMSVSYNKDQTLSYGESESMDQSAYLGPALCLSKSKKILQEENSELLGRSYMGKNGGNFVKPPPNLLLEIKMRGYFLLYKKKQTCLNKKGLVFNPFNANSAPPKTCDYEEFEASYENGVLQLEVN